MEILKSCRSPAEVQYSCNKCDRHTDILTFGFLGLLSQPKILVYNRLPSTPFVIMQYIVKYFYKRLYSPVESCLLEFDVVDGEVGGEGVTGLEAGSA